MTTDTLAIYGAFDNLGPIHFRFMEEAAKLGNVLALLWPDDVIKKVTGKPPKFPQEERLYLLESIRYIHKVIITNLRGCIPMEFPFDYLTCFCFWRSLLTIADTYR